MKKRRHFATPHPTDPHEVLLGFMERFDARLREVEALLDAGNGGRRPELKDAFYVLAPELARIFWFPDARAFKTWVSAVKQAGAFKPDNPVTYFYDGMTRRRYRAYSYAEMMQLRALRLRGRKRYLRSDPAGRAFAETDHIVTAGGGGWDLLPAE